MKGALRILALILVCFAMGIWGLRSSTGGPAASNQRGPGDSGAAGGAFLKGGVDHELQEVSKHGQGIYIVTASSAIQAAQEKEGER